MYKLEVTERTRQNYEIQLCMLYYLDRALVVGWTCFECFICRLSPLSPNPVATLFFMGLQPTAVPGHICKL